MDFHRKKLDIVAVVGFALGGGARDLSANGPNESFGGMVMGAGGCRATVIVSFCCWWYICREAKSSGDVVGMDILRGLVVSFAEAACNFLADSVRDKSSFERRGIREGGST